MFSFNRSFPLFRAALCALLCLSPLVIGPVKIACAQETRAADPALLGQTVHFTLDKDEQKDLAITLPPGQYFITADLKRVEGTSSNIFAGIDLLRANGTLVKGSILSANEAGIVWRVGGAFMVEKPYTDAKPLAALLHVKGKPVALEYWITVQPMAKRTFIPFGFANSALKPLEYGAENGKGGPLEGHEWAFRKITLPAGTYSVSLYMKQSDNKRDNIFGRLLLLDQYGVESKSPELYVNINEVDLETRKEAYVRLTKPQTLIFRVDNTNDKAMDYTLGIEKSTE